jgi:subtilase family serine protease
MVKSRVFLSAAVILFGLSLISHAALDLKFTTNITISPAAPKAGDTVTFKVTFKSEGAATANMKIVGGIDGVQKFERIYASIPANGTRTDSFTWTATEGSHKACFTLDPAHTTGDSNLGNNTTEKQFSVSGSGDQNGITIDKHSFKQTYKLKPDLKVHEVIWQPLEEPKCGKKWRMGVILINDGKVPVPKPFTVAVSVQGILADDHKMNGLNPGQTAGFYFDWYIFNDAYVRIVADFHNDIDESKEDNNAMWPPVKCVK